MAGYAPRDSQMSRLYKAESVLRLEHHGPMLSERETEAFMVKVQTSPYTIRKYGKSNVKLRLNSKRRTVAVASYGHIDLSASWARRKDVVIHELAHHYAGFVHQHDWRFCEVYLDLVRHFLGREAAEALKAGMKKYRVRFTAPRAKAPRTPAQVAAAEAGRERLAAARAARQGASGRFGILLTDDEGRALVGAINKWGRVTDFEIGVRRAKTWKTQAGVTEAFAKVSKVIERDGSHRYWNATPMTALVVDLDGLEDSGMRLNALQDIERYVVRF